MQEQEGRGMHVHYVHACMLLCAWCVHNGPKRIMGQNVIYTRNKFCYLAQQDTPSPPLSADCTLTQHMSTFFALCLVMMHQNKIKSDLQNQRFKSQKEIRPHCHIVCDGLNPPRDLDFQTLDRKVQHFALSLSAWSWCTSMYQIWSRKVQRFNRYGTQTLFQAFDLEVMGVMGWLSG